MAQHAQEQVERLEKTYRRLVCSVCGEPVAGRYSGRVQDMDFFTLGCGCPEVYAEGNWRVVIDEDGERDEANPQNHHFKDWDGIWVCTNCHGLKSTSVWGIMPTKPRCRCEGAFPYKAFFEFEASADEDAVDVPTIQVSQEEARAKHEVVFGWLPVKVTFGDSTQGIEWEVGYCDALKIVRAVITLHETFHSVRSNAMPKTHCLNLRIPEAARITSPIGTAPCSLARR